MDFPAPPGLELIRDVSAADWIDASLLRRRSVPDACLVGEVVPTGFEAYARILHPARDVRSGSERPIRWADLAARYGKTMHPEVQLKGILGADFRSGSPFGELPVEGRLPDELGPVLVELLTPATADPDRCWMAFWEGWGSWGGGVSYLSAAHGRDARWARRRRRREAERHAARARRALEDVPTTAIHPDPQGRDAFRRYFLFNGPVGAVPTTTIRGWPQSPSIWWPNDRAWVVVTEVDADSTYVGGSRGLVVALLADPRLEAVASDPRHRFDWGGDRVNAEQAPT